MLSLEQVLREKKKSECDLTSLSTLMWAFGYSLGGQLFAIKMSVTDEDVKDWQRRDM
ncbi:hypothetical protein MES5069_920002 [Mesorhizobium escarrei]|uniref:Uncharacterized protein n=1 Tax=Mesorhizobium escarrei TaxID=666018 RepID=A0ABM9EJR2_9HYPH|nr:hypothetical protein MES5069_920002 [Mesorhizobium escarrei]